MKWNINIKKNWLIKLIFVLNIVLLIIFGNATINSLKEGVSFTISYAEKYDSMPNFYYDNGNGFSEKYVILPTKYDGKNAQFFIEADIMTDISLLRFDYAQISGDVELVSLSINGKEDIDSQYLYDNLLLSNNVSNKRMNSKSSIVFEGISDDPSVLFSEDIIQCLKDNIRYDFHMVIVFIILIIISIILWIFIYNFKIQVIKIEEKIINMLHKICLFIKDIFYKNKYTKTTKIFFFIFFIIIILLSNIKVISEYKNLERRSYSIDQNPQFIETQEYQGNIQIYANYTDTISLVIQCNGSPSGYFDFSLVDESNNVVCDYSNMQIQKCIEQEERFGAYLLNIDVSDVNLLANNIYSSHISFDSEKTFSICLQENGEFWTKQYYTNNVQYIFNIVILCVDIIFIIILFILFKDGITDKNFIIISLAVGIIFSVFITPASQDDEYRHFIRAYDIAQGNFSSQQKEYDGLIKGQGIPENNGLMSYASVTDDLNQIRLLDDDHNYNNISYYAELNLDSSIDKYLAVITDEEKDISYEVGQTAVCSIGVLSYLPQSLMIFVGKLLGIRSFYLVYLARFGNVFVCTLLAYICLKLLPQYKAGIWVLHFMPGITTLRASSSTDGYLFALSLLLVSFIIYIRNAKKKIMSPYFLIIILFLATYIAIMKLPYVLIVGALVILEKENYRNEKYTFLKSLILAFCVFMASCILYFIYNNFLGPLANNSGTSSFISERQLNFLFTNTFDALNMMLNSWLIIWGKSGFFVGAIKGRLLDFGFGYIYIILLIITLVLLPNRLNFIKKILMLVLFGTIWFAIVLVFYGISDANSGVIWGISERYVNAIIPLVILILPSLKSQKTNIAEKIQYFTVLILMINSFQILNFYWIH